MDDEIELLKPYIIFLEKKGYEVVEATNGQDAIDICQERDVDLIFLDENMPGLTGLETLSRIKELNASMPVVMVTIETEVTNSNYQQNFSKLGMQINDSYSLEEWTEVYKRLVFWELELADANSPMTEMLKMQKAEANQGFAKFVAKNYQSWLDHPAERPLMSPDIFKKKVFPLLSEGEQVYLIVFDNFRYDQWRVISRELAGLFSFDEELYLSILPTATQYARNAIFSGLMPKQIADMYPELWVDEDTEEGKNLNEEPLIWKQMERYRRKESFAYYKLNLSRHGETGVAVPAAQQ